MTDIAALEAQLAEAKAALHRLMTGAQAVSVEYDGRKTAFTMINAAGLEAYVRTLEQRLARATGTGRRRAAKVWFR